MYLPFCLIALSLPLAVIDHALAAGESPTPSASSNTSAPAAAPIMNWTEFQGKVMRVDLQNQRVQIREGSTQTLIDVPVSRDVKIYKHGGYEYSLDDIKEGDKVRIRNNASS
jgi:hypothetical protein